MRDLERTFWTGATCLGAPAVAAAIFFGMFVYGMGMGAFSSQAYAAYSAIAEPAFFAALAWAPLVWILNGVAKHRNWGVRAYAILAAGCVAPGLVYLWAISTLY